jgi:hypothetical protein
VTREVMRADRVQFDIAECVSSKIQAKQRSFQQMPVRLRRLLRSFAYSLARRSIMFDGAPGDDAEGEMMEAIGSVKNFG